MVDSAVDRVDRVDRVDSQGSDLAFMSLRTEKGLSEPRRAGRHKKKSDRIRGEKRVTEFEKSDAAQKDDLEFCHSHMTSWSPAR